MASPRAMVSGMAMLHEAYPTRDITPKTTEVWSFLFADVPDAAFLAACSALAVERGRTFFPTPGELMALAVPPPPAPDVDGILTQIHDLGEYGPTGWRYPSLQAIRAELGEAIADAYTEAGAGRCFADSDRSGLSVTRDIARRAFAEALTAYRKTERHAIPAATTKLLTE